MGQKKVPINLKCSKASSLSGDRFGGVSPLSYGFVVVSLILVLSNFVSRDLPETLNHYAADKAVQASAVLQSPFAMIEQEISRLKALRDMQGTNDQLAQENHKLLEWYQAANRLEAENKALRELLHMKDEKALTYKAARVLDDVNTPFSNTGLIALGAQDGVDKGRGVMSHEGLIGRVIDTGDTTARVLYVNDVNSRIAVTIPDTGDRAILAGTNESQPILDHLPENHQIKAGQKVVTSGHGGIFPYGIPVGEVIMVGNRLAVSLFADPRRASYVQVLDYGIPAGSATRATASSAGVLR